MGLPILAKFVQYAVKGCPPELMGIGPAVAIPVLMEKINMKIDDIDIWEINEAFASQATYSIEKLGISKSKLNPKGGAIALGHPLGCTGTLLSHFRIQTNCHFIARTSQTKQEIRSCFYVYWNWHGCCCPNRKRMINHMSYFLFYSYYFEIISYFFNSFLYQSKISKKSLFLYKSINQSKIFISVGLLLLCLSCLLVIFFGTLFLNWFFSSYFGKYMHQYNNSDVHQTYNKNSLWLNSESSIVFRKIF